MPISSSPSPVTHTTRRLGCAMATPSAVGTREAHAAPGIEILGAVAGGEAVPGRAAEAAHDQRSAALREQLGDERAGAGSCWMRCSFLPEPLGADDALADQHGRAHAAVEGDVGGGSEGLADLLGLVDGEALDADGLERRPRAPGPSAPATD